MSSSKHPSEGLQNKAECLLPSAGLAPAPWLGQGPCPTLDGQLWDLSLGRWAQLPPGISAPSAQAIPSPQPGCSPEPLQQAPQAGRCHTAELLRLLGHLVMEGTDQTPPHALASLLVLFDAPKAVSRRRLCPSLHGKGCRNMALSSSHSQASLKSAQAKCVYN